MTGYGRARETKNGRDITVEVRSVNNRYLDCTVKQPRAYIFAEDKIKALVQKRVSRGKVDVFITVDALGAGETVVRVNEPLALSYLEAMARLTAVGGTSRVKGRIDVSDLARLPDVLTVTKAEEDLEAIAADILAVLDDAQLTPPERQFACMRILYPDWQEISDWGEAFRAAMQFVNCGKPVPENQPPKPKLVDWEKDVEIIAPAVDAVL